MVKIDNLHQTQTNQTETNGSQTFGSQKCGFDNQTNQNQQTPTKPNNLITTIGQLLPLAPFLFEQFTGQKVPQMSGTIAEMQTALVQIQSGMQTIVQNQTQIWKEIEQLKTNATNHLTNLTNQFQSLRLTHTQETKLSETQKKQIEFNPNKITNQEENY